MFTRRLSCLALLAILLASTARAQAQDVPPTLLLQFRSLDAVMENVKLLVALSGRENIAKQVEGLIKAKIGPKGLEGIDPARPFGAYGHLNGLNDATAIALIPIADENAFLNLLKNLNVEATKNAKTDIYTITGLPVEVFFRFSEKYAYVSTLNLDALAAKNLLPPDKVFRADQQATISLSLRLDQLPKDVKAKIFTEIDQGLQEAQKLLIPGEPPAQKALRLLAHQEIVDQFKAVLHEGQQFGIDLNVDKQAKEISLNFSLTAKANTALAKNIADIGKIQSLFANLRSKNAAIHASVSMALPQSLQKLFADAIDDAQAKVLANFNDPGRRKQAEELLNGLAPTFKAGELDAVFSLQGPNAKKQYNLILGVKIREGATLDKTLRTLLADLRENMKPEDKDSVELDFATEGGAKIHRFDLSKYYGEAKDVKEMFGDGPLLLAIRDDVLYFAVGPDVLPILKTALAKDKESRAAPLSIEFSLSRLWPLLPPNDKNRDKLQELFPPGSEASIRLSIDGGSSLNICATASLSLMQLMGMAWDKK